MAAQTHPPMVIFAMLAIVALVSALLAGNGMASPQSRSWMHMVGFAAVTALAIFVILDLEFPRLGWIHLEAFDQVLVDVLRSMK